jgi:hypothetical protein
MNDVRDEGLAAVLDREATRIESAPVDRLPEVLRRGTRLRAIRLTAIAAAVAIFAGAVSWAGLQNEGRETIPANIDDWDTFASLEENGWTVQVPPSWRVQELPACPNAPQRIGVSVTNTGFTFRDPRGELPACGERHVFAGFPPDGLVFQFHPWGDWGPFFRQPDTPFPLSAELLQRSGGIRGGPTESNTAVSVNGRIVGFVRRYVGPEASEGDIAALDRMIVSLQVRGASLWVESRVKSLGSLRISFARPDTWRFAGYRYPIVIDAPTPILRLWSPGPRGEGCELTGEPWIHALGVGRFDDYGVEFLVSDASESWSPPDLPPRPATFRMGHASSRRSVNCGGASIRVLTFEFQEAGRPIVIHVLGTDAAYRAQPRVLLHILNSIRIEKA